MSVLISIHAPLAGCDAPTNATDIYKADFNPRTPCGVRHDVDLFVQVYHNFNPRTPCGVRLAAVAPLPQPNFISIHAPLAGCDDRRGVLEADIVNFNPRTPCGVRPR